MAPPQALASFDPLDKCNGVKGGCCEDGLAVLLGECVGSGDGPAFSCPPTCTTPAAGGSNHSLAVLEDGTVWAWGDNDFGQLGNGSNHGSTSGVQVSGLTGVVSVASAGHHSLALKSDGKVWAWGSNIRGELGDGTTEERTSPVQVANLTGIMAIAAGASHSLAVSSNGDVFGWGANEFGQLGDGTTTGSLTPGHIAGLSGVSDIAAGYYHSLARTTSGAVFSWGMNAQGQLGNGSTTSRSTPGLVNGVSSVSAVAAGAFHSLALIYDSGGTVRAWGLNSDGQLGDGSTTDRTSPVVVSGLSDATFLAAGFSHSLALKSNGTAAGWGYNRHGAVGDNTTNNRSTPSTVRQPDGTIFTDINFIAAGNHHSLFVSGGVLLESGLHPTPLQEPIPDCLAPTEKATPKNVKFRGLRPAIAAAAAAATIVALRSQGSCPFQVVDPNEVATSRANSAIDKFGVHDTLVDGLGNGVYLRWGNEDWGKLHIDDKYGHGWGSSSAGSQSDSNPRYRSSQALLQGGFAGRVKDKYPGSYAYYYHYVWGPDSTQCTRRTIVNFSTAPGENLPKHIITAFDEEGWQEEPAGNW